VNVDSILIVVGVALAVLSFTLPHEASGDSVPAGPVLVFTGGLVVAFIGFAMRKAAHQDSIGGDEDAAEDDETESPGQSFRFRAQMRAIEERARAEDKSQLAALADTGVTEDQLHLLEWEYLEAGLPDDSLSRLSGPEFITWARERLALGPVLEEGAEGRVKQRWRDEGRFPPLGS
jgi:hypothetical protein